MPATVSCPSCGAEVVWGPDSPHRPFCSERCRLIDLGAWADGKYRVPVADEPDPGGGSEPDAGDAR